MEATPDIKHNGTSKLLDSAKDKGYTASFKPVNKIDDTEVSWTLGNIILYASSQIPPLDTDALPVGFGSNVPGISEDFQYPSAEHLQLLPVSNSSVTSSQPRPEATQITPTSILRTATPRRIPGILLFLLILCFAIYLLLGRSRRSRLYSKISSQHSSGSNRSIKRIFFPAKLPSLFRSSPRLGAYERVDLEEGGLAAPENFELGGLEDESSDSSSGSYAGKTSGWTTPRSRDGNGHGHGSASFESLGRGHGLGIGLTGSAMERSGLIVRTESRERIAGMVEGRRSRKGSPQRGIGLRLHRLMED